MAFHQRCDVYFVKVLVDGEHFIGGWDNSGFKPIVEIDVAHPQILWAEYYIPIVDYLIARIIRAGHLFVEILSLAK